MGAGWWGEECVLTTPFIEQVVAADSACTSASARRLQSAFQHRFTAEESEAIMFMVGAARQASRPFVGAPHLRCGRRCR